LSHSDGAMIPSFDDWNAHWANFATSAERNPAQAYRRRLVIDLLCRAGAPDRYLDVGSGQGDLAVQVATRWPDAEIAGIEFTDVGVAIAAEKVSRGRFVAVDLLSGRPPIAGFEAWATHATCTEVLEHVDEPDAFLRSALAWLAPGATLIVTVPGGPMSAFDRQIGHRRHYTIDDLTTLLDGAGYVVGECGGAGFPVFNLYRRTVIARGDKLVDDVCGADVLPLAVRAALRVSDLLFRVSSTAGGRRGWQLYAVVTVPSSVGSS
jgi:SAM-dependent methyltransferase